jgi:DNA-binding transcriptional LysR family regulator
MCGRILNCMDNFALLLSKGGLSLDRLHNFCRIAEAGSLSKAADGDPGKLSLYSRQIRELEEFFGVELKRRHGKGIVITEAGRRLAQVTRAHLRGLEDFQREARQIPKRLSIASGNSVLEWTLLPKLGELRAALPVTTLELFSERTINMVTRLVDMTLDIGLVRENALTAPLKGKRLFIADYALFIPRKLARGITAENLKTRIADLPLAATIGGQFRQILDASAAKAKWPLNIVVSCSSFTQAARTVQAGACAAVLPQIATHEFAAGEVVQLPFPFLRERFRHICVAWNPRLAEVRSILAEAVAAIEESLRQ